MLPEVTATLALVDGFKFIFLTLITWSFLDNFFLEFLRLFNYVSFEFTIGFKHCVAKAFKRVDVTTKFLLVWTIVQIKMIFPIQVFNEGFFAITDFSAVQALSKIKKTIPLDLNVVKIMAFVLNMLV